MTREKLQRAQKEMKQRNTQAPRVSQMELARKLSAPDSKCAIPFQWRYTVTLALRALIRSCHDGCNEAGCNAALQCARELGLDVETVAKYTHLEKKEDGNAK